MKRLFFGYRQKEICTKCGNIIFAPCSKENEPDIYRSECHECYDTKLINIRLVSKQRRQSFKEQ